MVIAMTHTVFHMYLVILSALGSSPRVALREIGINPYSSCNVLSVRPELINYSFKFAYYSVPNFLVNTLIVLSKTADSNAVAAGYGATGTAWASPLFMAIFWQV